MPLFGLLRRKAKTEVAAAAEPGEQRALGDDLLSIFGLGGVSVSGPAVNATTAMRCPAVRNAVLAISEAVGQLPVHVYRRDGDAKDRDPSHPVQSLLHDAANPWTGAAEFREQLTRDALLHDAGGIAFINRVRGKPVELIRFEPGAVTVETDTQDGSPIYRRNGPNGTRIIPRDDILHIRPPGGRAPITDCKEAIALAMAMEAYAARLFGNGGRPSGILKFPAKLGAETAKRIRESWRAATSGENSGRTAVLEEGGEFQPLAFKSTDAQFHEARLFAINEIARAFKMSPIFLQEYGRATWSNSAEMGRQFLVYCLTPYLVRWESEIRLKLFEPEERETHYAEFLTDALTRADIATRTAAYAAQISARILSPNEARAAEGRPPYEGGDKFENPNTTAGGGNDD